MLSNDVLKRLYQLMIRMKEREYGDEWEAAG